MHHLRIRNNDHEVDFIVERDDHRVVALEVKLSNVIYDHDVIHLHWLRHEIGDDLIDAAVIYTGYNAYRRPDGVDSHPRRAAWTITNSSKSILQAVSPEKVIWGLTPARLSARPLPKRA